MTVTIKLNDVAEAALRAASERSGKSIAELVVQVIGEFVARESIRPTEEDTPVTSEALKAYWDRTPDPDEGIEDFIAGEASGLEDPVEGILVEVTRPAPLA